jgi:hypothetical protein
VDRRRRQGPGAVALGLLALALACPADSSDETPTFEGISWVGDAPSLKGKVALVRWWTQG